MSDSKLFSLRGDGIQELTPSIATLERDLQRQVEAHMPVFLGAEFLATEYSTGQTHRGRIDSLGLDENNCPVIIEYKRNRHENVINQGLFYLDWLLDHKAEFQWLVMEKLGKQLAENIEWNGTRLICIAADFTRYDEHAVQQINRNIELMRYRYFGEDLLLLELVNVQSSEPPASSSVKTTVTEANATEPDNGRRDKTNQDRLCDASPELLGLYEELCRYTLELGDEVQQRDLKQYTAFKRIRNFASVVVMSGRKDPRLLVTLTLPGELAEEDGFSRDVSNIGHWGTGDLELSVRTPEDLERAKAWITRSYEAS